MDKQNEQMDWNDEIENDGEDFVLLPEGEYDFVVKSFERGRFAGGKVIGPCNKAILHLEVDGGDAGTAYVKEDLFLHEKAEWKVCAFFTSIGQRKKGEKFRMNWASVAGAKGRCKLGIRSYEKNGETRQINSLTDFLAPLETTQVSGTGYTKAPF